MVLNKYKKNESYNSSNQIQAFTKTTKKDVQYYKNTVRAYCCQSYQVSAYQLINMQMKL